MKRVGVIWGLALAAVLVGGCKHEETDCERVERAVAELGSGNELAVRVAVRELGELGGSRCIMEAVGPLTDALNAGQKHDIYTRSLVPGTLAKIARSRHDRGEAMAALGPLFDVMIRDRSDLLRAKTAVALGESGQSEATAPLKAAAVTDDSMLVREAAKSALYALGQGPAPGGGHGHGRGGSGGNHGGKSKSGASPALTMGPASGTMAAAGGPMAAASGGGSAAGDSVSGNCISPEMDELLRKHVIVLDPSRPRLPVCGR